MFRAIGNVLRIFPLFLGGVFMIVVIWLFLVFPRVVNQLADLLGNMGQPTARLPFELSQGIIHAGIAFIISLLPLYFFIIRPLRQVEYQREGQGLAVIKGQGVGYIDTESVRQQIYTGILRLPNIQRAEVTVENDVGRANIFVNLLTESSINASRKKMEVRREIKKIVEDQFGIGLASEPTINMRLNQPEMDIPQARLEPTNGTTVAVRPSTAPIPTTTYPIPEPSPAYHDTPVTTTPLKEEQVFNRRAFMPSTPNTPPPLAEPRVTDTTLSEDITPTMDDSPSSFTDERPVE